MPCAAAAACSAYMELVDAEAEAPGSEGGEAAVEEDASDSRGFVHVVSCVLEL